MAQGITGFFYVTDYYKLFQNVLIIGAKLVKFCVINKEMDKIKEWWTFFLSADYY